MWNPGGDQAIPLQFRDLTRNRLDREAEVISYVEATKWDVDFDRGHRIRPGSPGNLKEEGGDPLIRSRPTEMHDLILRSRHFTGDRAEKLRAEIPVPVNEFDGSGAAQAV